MTCQLHAVGKVIRNASHQFLKRSGSRLSVIVAGLENAGHAFFGGIFADCGRFSKNFLLTLWVSVNSANLNRVRYQITTAFLRTDYCRPSCQEMQPDNGEKGTEFALRNSSLSSFVQHLKSRSWGNRSDVPLFSLAERFLLGFMSTRRLIQGCSGPRIESRCFFPLGKLSKFLSPVQETHKSLLVNTLRSRAPSGLTTLAETAVLHSLDFM